MKYINIMSKPKTIRLSDSTIADIGKSELPFSTEINRRLELLKKIQDYSTNEIKGIFVESEWKSLADMLNGLSVDTDFRVMRGGLIAQVDDSERYEGTCSRWGINKADLNKKIEGLSASQVEAVYRRCEEFWNDKDRDLDSWSIY